MGVMAVMGDGDGAVLVVVVCCSGKSSVENSDLCWAVLGGRARVLYRAAWGVVKVPYSEGQRDLLR